MADTVSLIRDILVSAYLIAGLVLTVALTLFACLLFKAVRGLIGAATKTVQDVGKVSDAAVDHIVTPLEEGVSFSSTIGNAVGFATGFIAGLRGRRKEGSADKGRRRGRR